MSCRDNQGHLPFFKDFNVFRPRLSQSSLPQRLSSPLACGDNHGHLLSLHFQDYQSLSSCGDNHGHLFSLLFQDYQSMLSCRDYQCLPPFALSKTIRVFCFKDYQSLLLRFQCLPYFARLQGLLLIYLMSLIILLLTSYTAWALASGRSDGEITRMKLVSFSSLLLPIKDK